MKRSIAFLLAAIMCIGMIPSTLLPVLAHGIGVGKTDVENLSLDNAPNQKIPATVDLDAKVDDTAWKNDEWQTANAHEGIWSTASNATNPDFAYRYQLHVDYEFVYGVIQVDKSDTSLKSGTLSEMTVWFNDGSDPANTHYTSKLVIDTTNYTIGIYKYGSDENIANKYAKYQYEHATVVTDETDGILTLEFKGLVSAVLDKEITEEITLSLTSFVSAKVTTDKGAEYLYHPRVDAEQDAKNINLAEKWEDGAVEITQDMIYDTVPNPQSANQLDVDWVDHITVDGHLGEEAWKSMSSYGGSNFETFTEYKTYTEGGHAIPNYDVEYSVEYMYHDGSHVIENETYKELDTYADKWIHYHDDNVGYIEHPHKANGEVIYTPGYFHGNIWPGYANETGAQSEHFCTAKCEEAFINNIPVKFKYQIKSNDTGIFGAMVVDLSIYNKGTPVEGEAPPFYQTGDTYTTFFKFMVATKGKPDGINPWTTYSQIELQHTLKGAESKNYSDPKYNTSIITANSQLGDSGKTDNYGNTVLSDGVGAYAKRLNSSTMVFEFYASYEQLNAHHKGIGDATFEPGKEVSVILSVGNMSSSVAHAGAANGDYNEYAVHAANANWFGHDGRYDVLGRGNTHKYTLGTDGISFSKGLANGSLDSGIFNGLRAHDRFINSAYRYPDANGNFSISEGDIGAIEYFDYSLYMSTEYLYGAAVVKKNGYDKNTYDTLFDDYDALRLWVNNGNPQWRDRYDYVLTFFLDPENSRTVEIRNGNKDITAHSDYASSGTLYNGGVDLGKGVETFSVSSTISTDGIQYSRRSLTNGSSNQYLPEYITDHSSGSGGEHEGEIVVIEFKIPLEKLGISEKYAEKIGESGSDIALSYYVSAGSRTDGTQGIYAPISDNTLLNGDNESGWNYGKEKEFVGVNVGGWICTNHDGVNGARYISSNHRTNQFVIDGILDEVIWNDEEERVWVNSTTGSWGNEPDVPYMFDYQNVVYTGREYIYGAAQINTAASDNESLVYTLWIKNDKHLANPTVDANLKFSIVQMGDHAVCYGIDGKEIPLTRKQETWSSAHTSTYYLQYTDGMVAMTNLNGITYVEFMLSLEALGITLHEAGEDKWTQYVSYGDGGVEPLLPSTDKFFYYWDATSGAFVENKKMGFEYFVSVTKMDEKREHSNTLYYPAPEIAAPEAITEKDRFCHLSDDGNYNSSDRWDELNSLAITPVGYFLPETITIDGDLSDSGWRDDMWIEVEAGVNGNLQNPVENMIGSTEAPYKFQMRADAEYVYVAAVVDVPASPIRHNIKEYGEDLVTYSYPRVRIWLQSKDTDYEIIVNHNGLKVDGSTTHTYKFADAVSFTHLYDVTLGYGKDGKATNQTLSITTPEQYVPESYVTWQGDDVPHVTADEFTKLNDSLNPTLLTNTNTLRYAINHTGFFAPFGGNARKATDIIGVTGYKFNAEDEFTSNVSGGKYPTVHNYYEYAATDFYGVTEVVEENTVTARHADGSSEAAYTDKDWYAKPEIKKYVYANEHAVMTSDETGTKTVAEFRFPLSDIGCEDGEDFEYFIQGGTDGRNTDSGYTLFYPPITYGFSKTTNDEAPKTDGRPYWYWATTGKLVDAAERERLQLRNNYEPVTPIGVQYKENYTYGGNNYIGMKFGMLYDADYLRQPRITDENSIYKNATYWDIKEIGMLLGYTDSLEDDVSNLNNDNIDNYNIYRLESDVILNQIKGTDMADYESYVFYAIQLLYPGQQDLKLTYRGFVEYYPQEHMYYGMADKVFGETQYSNPNGDYFGKPLKLEGVNGDPTKIPNEFTYRPTFYSDPVTRNANMILYADKTLKEDSDNLPTTILPSEVIKPNANGTKILYVPIDDRPINLERVQYQAEAAGFEIVMPPADMITTRVDKEHEGKSDQGDPKRLYEWLKTEFRSNEYHYVILSLDQLFSGGLMGSREPFYDTEDSIANISGLNSYNPSVGGYELSDDPNAVDETDMVELLKEIAESPNVYSVFFDTVKRLASSGDFFDMDTDPDYTSYRVYGTFARPQLYGSALTIENIVAGYNKRADGSDIALPISGASAAIQSQLTAQGFNASTDYYCVLYKDSEGNEITDRAPSADEIARDGITEHYYGLEDYAMYIAARERKLRIAQELYPTIVKEADCFYVGYDDSKPFVTVQTNDGRYIEEKLLKNADNSFIFSGTDELGMMGLAKTATDIYGEVSVNVEFFGIGKDEPGDAYDTSTLYNNVMAHINGVGGKYSYYGDGEVDVLILTRSDHSDFVPGKTNASYSSSDITELKKYAGQLIDRVDANLKAGIPTIVVDCAFKDDYLAAMMMQRYSTDTHTADISNRLNQLLAYSQWNTSANSLGTAISNGLSRYTYLKNCDPAGISEESHMGAYKANVKAWVKDYGYQSTEVSNSNLNRSKPFNGESGFATSYNNFWEINKYIMSKLNASSVATGVDENGKLVIPADNAYRASVSNLWWRWDRGFEANFDISVVPKAEYQPVDYDDYKVVNLALGKNYTTSVTPSDSYPDSGNELTDGIKYYKPETKLAQYQASAWVGHEMSSATANPSGNNYVDITVDLGEVKDVYQASTQILNYGSAGIYAPGYIQLYTSTDNENFTLQRTIQTADLAVGVHTIYLGTNMTSAEARYVKLRYGKGGGGWVFTSEITVLGLDENRAEYVNSDGLYFSYTTTNTPYIYYSWVNGVEDKTKPQMTADSNNRLRWYDSSENMYETSAMYSGYNKTYMSGWKWDANGEVNIDMYFTNANIYVTQVAALVVEDSHVEGVDWRIPEFKLSYEDANGNVVELDTNVYNIKYVDWEKNDRPKDNIDVTFDAYRCVIELKDGVWLPSGNNLTLTMQKGDSLFNAVILTGLQVIGRYANNYVDVADTAVDYEFIGEHANDAGYAQGIITIAPVSNLRDNGYYHIYYTDADGNLLAGYDSIADFTATTNIDTYEVPAGIMLPAGAAGIAVFHDANPFVGKDVTLNVADAIATMAIPAEKQLQTSNLGNVEAVFGAASDVHINYENWGSRNAIAKWTNALTFFKNNGAEYVIVTGDMTGDDNYSNDGPLATQYANYNAAISASGFNNTLIYESLGNHGATSSELSLFYSATHTGGEVYPVEGTHNPYFYVVKEGEDNEKDNVFVFMHLDPGSEDKEIANNDSIGDDQITWLTNVLNEFDTDENNVFVICHSPFLNYGAGDVYKGGGYTDLLHFDGTNTTTKNVLALQCLLQEHKDVVVMSGHTHLTLYDGANYSNVNGEFAHTVHVPSTCWPRGYQVDGSCPAGTDGRYSADTATYGSEAYLVTVYENYIVYTGYNLSTGKIIPAACFMIPTSQEVVSDPYAVFEGSGTVSDPYLIQDAEDFMLLTDGFSSDAYKGGQASSYGLGKYFKQTADIDMTEIEAYIGTYAGSPKDVILNAHNPGFGGVYDGGGYTITVDIDALGSRSVFPYLYGTIANLKIEGSISGTKAHQTGGAAQPIARVRENANVINCYFDLALSGTETSGVTKSTNVSSNIYNVYVAGVQNGLVEYAMTNTADTGSPNNANTYYKYSGNAFSTDSFGTRVEYNTIFVDDVVAAFNNTASTGYQQAKAIADSLGIELCPAVVSNGTLAFVN